MSSTPDGVRIFHLRNRFGPCPGDILPQAGITVAVLAGADGNVYGAVGVCGHQHTFNRKRGREVAVGRIEKLMRNDSSKFAQVFPAFQFGNDTEFERAMTIAHILVDDSHLKGKQRRVAQEVISTTEEHIRFMAEIGEDHRLVFTNVGVATGRVRSDRPNKAHAGGCREDE